MYQKSPQATLCVLGRCWHDPEDIPPQAALADPLLRPLKQGEVGISYISHHEAREIIDESEVVLIDRGLRPGDYCKRSVDDLRSGVVTGVKVKARVAHVINGVPVDGWKTTEDLVEKQGAEVGDYVVYEDWIGQVFDESIIEVANGRLVRLPELGSRLATGDVGTDILPPAPVANNVSSAIRSLFGGQNNGVDRVIHAKHTGYAVAWLALNQTLDVDDAANRTRPPRFWVGSDISKLTLVRGKADAEMRVGDRVNLKNTEDLPMTEHGNEKEPAGIVHVQTFKVTDTETTIDILWQDGEKETVRSVDVIPYVSPDEYDCWPGDHVLWKAEGQQRFAVVQSVNPAERTANLVFEDKTQELVSVLELDPNGNTDPFANQAPHDALGVRRGDFVFIHPEGKTNGMTPPKVPHIGELEPWVREIPIMDGQYVGWRKDFAKLGNAAAAARASSELFDSSIKRPVKGDESLYWIGEVSDLRLDGTVEVTHPDWTTRIYPLERLTRLYDGMDQLEDDPWADSMSMEDEYEAGYEAGYGPAYGDYYVDELGGEWTVDEEGQWQEEGEFEHDHWEHDGVVEGGHFHPCTCRHHPEDGESQEMDSPEPESIARRPPPELETSLLPTPDSFEKQNTPSPSDIALPPLEEGSVQSPSVSVTANIPKEAEEWKRFDILESAPADHAFYSTTPAQPSKTFLGRLSKEYKALSSSLPDSIIVRAYEDRADLLRSLIIGPENTPYQDAPFVIDWMLDSNFPHINPNLYEDGKVCLSILGTWVGDQSETWSAARSSLLQAFVSIQGLVLVKEPWFCEPAYDKLRGTEEGIVNRCAFIPTPLPKFSLASTADSTTRRHTSYREVSFVVRSRSSPEV
ncbi:hypothetical protein CC1G_01745 [Coprinopsis cinerea okayama7|uniref:UBC core domain-containing protein n=1 Tax=Coprinopsis cinerea (strain Okayama-7 / 130 / ATCC MYA-4618 / FGSC 9003) TaxID=240176 RepID=A8N2A5_COPC7|nr:hypothetical protein CC1G_01745 [Coprinopsis cinerea okayama7\|eukprot:XP_001829065.2 hypothetical protein CC1G_01745 [Coprinopsis cinerea okayama7\